MTRGEAYDLWTLVDADSTHRHRGGPVIYPEPEGDARVARYDTNRTDWYVWVNEGDLYQNEVLLSSWDDWMKVRHAFDE